MQPVCLNETTTLNSPGWFFWPITKLRRGGTLPRADRTLQPWQRALVAEALEQGKQAVLCAHFTLINYCISKPLAESGRFEVESLFFSAFDQGSCQRERSHLYGRFLTHPALKLTLSGHSHRAEVYNWRYNPPIHLVNTLVPAHLTCRGHHPEAEEARRIDWNGRAQVFVTASAGPIPKQNLQGEMSGQGMESPSAGKIVFNGSDPKITLARSQQSAAKPRFAVACDYIDVMEGGFWEYFRAVGNSGEFEMKIHWEKILPNFSLASVQAANVRISNSRMRVSFARSVIPKVSARDSEFIVIGLSEANMPHVTLVNSRIHYLSLWDGFAEEMIIQDSQINQIEGENFKGNHILWHNVTLDGEINLTNAQVKDFRPTHLKRGPNLNLTTTGSNLRFDFNAE